MKKVYGITYIILRDVPETRSSDKELLLAYWETEGLYLTPHQQRLFRQCTTPESVTRQRRQIQADGEFPANSNVRQRRKELEDEMVQEALEVIRQEQIAEQLSWIGE